MTPLDLIIVCVGDWCWFFFSAGVGRVVYNCSKTSVIDDSFWKGRKSCSNILQSNKTLSRFYCISIFVVFILPRVIPAVAGEDRERDNKPWYCIRQPRFILCPSGWLRPGPLRYENRWRKVIWGQFVSLVKLLCIARSLLCFCCCFWFLENTFFFLLPICAGDF